MANADIPRGLSVARDQASGVMTGGASRYFIPDTDTQPAYLGSLVKLSGEGDADGVAAVTANVAAGDQVLGVVVGIDSLNRDDAVHRKASEAQYVFVADDPRLIFEVQEDGNSAAEGAPLSPADIGTEKALTGLLAGSDLTGRSAIEIDSDGAGTDVMILGLVQRDDNEVGDYAKWRVRLQNHSFRDNAATAV